MFQIYDSCAGTTHICPLRVLSCILSPLVTWRFPFSSLFCKLAMGMNEMQTTLLNNFNCSLQNAVSMKRKELVNFDFFSHHKHRNDELH